jgi:polyhydroxyalkanoate synthase
MGIADYICDELHWAVRETRRAAGSSQIGLLGWCIGAALVAMYAALYPEDLASLTLLTMPVDTEGSLYHKWVNASTYDVDALTAAQPTIAGGGIDWANRTMRPVVNYWMPYRRLWEQVAAGTVNRDAYQSMAKWVADNPPFPGKAYQEWIKWIYQENRLVRGRVRLRGQRVDFGKITCPILVVTASQDHIAPRAGTLPILDMFGSSDITHFDRAGGHIGLMAGSKARKEIWPDIANWLEPRSQLHG